MVFGKTAGLFPPQLQTTLPEGFRIDNNGVFLTYTSVQNKIYKNMDQRELNEIYMYLDQRELNEELWFAAMRGDTKSVEDSVARGADVNCKDYGLSPLHLASWHCQTETVSRLVELGADINAKDNNYGWSPLHLASANGNTETVSRLVDLGGHVNAKDKYGLSPLHEASREGHTETVSRLVELGGDIDIKDNKLGRSPLHLASANRHTETVSRLVELGGDINAKDNELGRSPLHLASANRHTETVSRLVELGGDINAKDNEGHTPYELAENEVIKKLLKDAEDHIRAGLPIEFFHLDKQSASVFTALLKEGSFELFELRSMLQGEQGTGKSTIARFLVGKGPTKFRMSTDGIDLYTGLSFFDDETNEWIGGKQGFAMPDITVSRSIKSFKKQGASHEEETIEYTERKKTESELSADISEVIYERQGHTPLSSEETDKGVMKKQVLAFQSRTETDMPDINPMLSQEKYGEMLQKQSYIPENMQGSKSKNQESKHCLMGQQLQSNMHQRDTKGKFKDQIRESEKESGLKHDDYYGIIKNPGLVEKVKAIFGVKKEVKEIKISVTKEEFLNQSKQVSKMNFHKRKIVPVTIWDFGGQDVFYSTHQTFLTYRAVYMLIVDGSRTLNEPCIFEQFLPGREGAKTQKDYVRFWINTIITYCKGESTGFPKIMVILTHKDKLKQTEIEARRNEIFGEIKDMFDGSPIGHHLAIEDRIFVNARNSNDPEMDKIKHSLIHQARIQPTWGQKLPKCFLPLELEIQYLVKKGYTLIHIEHMRKINDQQAIRPLTSSELKVFLKFQHSVGKILYFDEPYLDQNIIISPKFLIDAFKSIITDQQFCKGDKQKEEAWYSMDKKGIILKQAVETVWKQKKYAHFYKSMWYLLGVMTHLDILVEPRRYDSHHHRIPTDFYYVASMVRKQDTTKYLQSPTFSQRNIAISFDTYGSIIPPALSFRFISYCLSIWGVKTYGNEDMLFHRSAVFTVDPSLDVNIQCEDERLIVRLVHARNRALITRDLASGIRECLTAALHKISQLYVRTSSESTSNIRSFEVKVCCSSSEDPCSIAIKDIGDVWICSGHQIEHGKDLALSWFREKGKEKCESVCPMTDPEFLKQTPTDLHLRRLALVYNTTEVRELVIALGLEHQILDDLYINRLSEEDYRFRALEKCFKMTYFTFEDFKAAANSEHIQNPHTICKVVGTRARKPTTEPIVKGKLRAEHISFDRDPEKWDMVVTDEDIDKLATLVGQDSLGFLVELDLTFMDWEKIESSEKDRDLVKLNRKIMEVWRTKCKDYNIKPALRTIAQAFENIGINIKNIENLLFN